MTEPNVTDNSEAENITQQADITQARTQSFAFFIALFVCILLCSYFCAGNVGESGRPPGVRLESRINPNEAPLGSLVRLPSVGISRAGAIIAYREKLQKNEKDACVFQTPNDLEKVKGIGPKTVKNITDSLKFD